MPLDDYRRKRRFDATPEPSADAPPPKAVGGKRADLSFVVQKHAASRLHYDFRLEHEGVLVSWAVPKGPSLDPSQKRLAVKVEDHPLAYGGFEGTIPAGQYGGGEVIVWDRGRWEPDGDPAEMLAAGRLKFRLAGEKLEGAWSLVRTGGARGSSGGDKNWLLIKSQDAAAVPLADGDVLVDWPESVISGKTLGDDARPLETNPSLAAKRTRRAGPKAAKRAAARRPADRPGPGDAEATVVSGVRVTHAGRVIDPTSGVTKVQVATYVAAVADRLLEELAGRPLALVRCPEGLAGDRFFQKHPGGRTPEAVSSLDVEGEPKPWIGVRNAAGLVSLVQHGTLEFHPWGARADRPGRPDRMVFDLDPGEGVAWDEVVAAGSLIRALLDDAGLAGFAKTTGGKGLHVVVPLSRRQAWEEVAEFSKALATRLAEVRPKRFTAAAAKAARPGKIYIDYLRNGWGATAVAAYSARAREGMPVAVPVSWDELVSRPDPGDFTVRTVPDRLASLAADPWYGFGEVRQSITAKAREAVGL